MAESGILLVRFNASMELVRVRDAFSAADPGGASSILAGARAVSK